MNKRRYLINRMLMCTTQNLATSRYYSLFLFCASLLTITPSCHSYSHDQVALFIFGDSLFDAGNNQYLKNSRGLASVWPYGETFFKRPTGRASDGRLIPDFIAEFAKLPFLSPYLQPGNHQYINGVNFASGGAGALVETHRGMVIDLKAQVRYFKIVEKQLRQELGVAKSEKLLSTAVYLFSIGNNDYFASIITNSTVQQSYSKKEYVNMVVGNITTVIQEIYMAGGRKFGLLKLGALGCVPLLRALKQATTNGSGCLNEVTVLAKQHDKELSKGLQGLERQLKGFRYSYFDFYTATKERVKKPSKYGFKEAKEACCGSGPYRGALTCGRPGYQLCDNVNDHIFFDGIHPTEKFNYQLAKLMWSGNLSITGPCNLAALFNE